MESTPTEKQRVLNINVVQVSFEFSSSAASSHSPHTSLTQHKDTLINMINRGSLLMDNSVKWCLAVRVNF